MTAQEIERHIAPMIGLPYRPGFRCWDLVRHVSLVLFDRHLPEVPEEIEGNLQIARAFRGNPERAKWRITNWPHSGSIVLMGAATREMHAGIYLDIDGGAVLHTQEKTGVALDAFSELRSNVHTLNCYEYVG